MDKFVTIGHEFCFLAEINHVVLIFSVASTEICVLTHRDSIYDCWLDLEVANLPKTDENITEKHMTS